MATDSHVSYLSARSIQLWRSCTRRRRRRIHLWWRRACSSCASIRRGARGRCVWRRGACGFWCRTTRSRCATITTTTTTLSKKNSFSLTVLFRVLLTKSQVVASASARHRRLALRPALGRRPHSRRRPHPLAHPRAAASVLRHCPLRCHPMHPCPAPHADHVCTQQLHTQTHILVITYYSDPAHAACVCLRAYALTPHPSASLLPCAQVHLLAVRLRHSAPPPPPLPQVRADSADSAPRPHPRPALAPPRPPPPLSAPPPPPLRAVSVLRPEALRPLLHLASAPLPRPLPRAASARPPPRRLQALALRPEVLVPPPPPPPERLVRCPQLRQGDSVPPPLLLRPVALASVVRPRLRWRPEQLASLARPPLLVHRQLARLARRRRRVAGSLARLRLPRLQLLVASAASALQLRRPLHQQLADYSAPPRRPRPPPPVDSAVLAPQLLRRPPPQLRVAVSSARLPLHQPPLRPVASAVLVRGLHQPLHLPQLHQLAACLVLPRRRRRWAAVSSARLRLHQPPLRPVASAVLAQLLHQLLHQLLPQPLAAACLARPPPPPALPPPPHQVYSPPQPPHQPCLH